MALDRRQFLKSSAAVAAAGSFAAPPLALSKGESIGGDRPLLEPVHDMIACPWTPKHPRNDHQLIFPLDETRQLLVWSEYYAKGPTPSSRRGHTGVGDAFSCQISSMVSTDRGRKDRHVRR